MQLDRRAFLTTLAGAPGLLQAAETKVVPEWERPVFDLPGTVKEPVKVSSIELLRNGSNWFVRTRSEDGAEGVVQTKQVEDYVDILFKRVAPIYLGQDARDLESLVDEAYIKNYKMAGQALFCPIAYIEESLFDLLGKTAKKTAGELMGGVLRKEIPVYLSGSGRDTTAEEEVDVYVQGVEATGARGVKFKIGGRMSRNLDAYPGRTPTLIELARKRLGDDVILYADANGSYEAKMAIDVGRRLEELDYRFFEEPCPWQEYDETQTVTRALRIPVAAGEMDSSLWQFDWMLRNEVMRIVQPDLNYNGGFVRAARVARMAKEYGLKITPHNTQTGAAASNMLHFCAATENIGDLMEFAWRKPRRPESWYGPFLDVVNGVVKVPTGHGLGVEMDPDYLAKAERVGMVKA